MKKLFPLLHFIFCILYNYAGASSADECAKHDNSLCQQCAEVCRTCAEARSVGDTTN